MKTYNILDLTPLEDFIRTSSLRFLTQVWRNFGNFSALSNPPYVREHNGELYTEDGNHRCVWNLINGIYTINAEVEEPDDDVARVTLLTVNSVRRRGINTFFDLAGIVEEPLQYDRSGPITHRISSTDLKNPEYFLRV